MDKKRYLLCEVIEREVNLFEFESLEDARLAQITYFCDFNHNHLDTEIEVLLRAGKVSEVISDGEFDGFGDEWEIADHTCWSNLNSSANYDSYIFETPIKYHVNTESLKQYNEKFVAKHSKSEDGLNCSFA